MKNWLIKLAGQFLTENGYWVIPSTIPCLILSYGIALRTKEPDGSTSYEVNMPAGHKLWVLNNSQVVPK